MLTRSVLLASSSRDQSNNHPTSRTQGKQLPGPPPAPRSEPSGLNIEPSIGSSERAGRPRPIRRLIENIMQSDRLCFLDRNMSKYS
jgi:hypothetical protein